MVAGLATVDRSERVTRRVAETPRWPLLGRDDELARIDGAIGRARRSIVVVGAAGVGKSRLIADWLERQGHARAPAVVRATRSTATIPFGAFARWVPDQHRTHDRLGLFRSTAANLLGDPATAGLDSGDGSGDGSRDDDGGRVVVVDDAQLLDDGSAALLLHLAQHTPARLLVTVRVGEPCPDAVVALWKDGLADRIDLTPLDQHDTGELARAALGGRVAASARRRLWRLTEGNPLYLREVLDAARDQGVLAVRGTRWCWDGDLAGRGRLDDLVSDRLGAGDPEERRVLELVALGEPLPVDLLARLVPPARLAAVCGGTAGNLGNGHRSDLLVEEHLAHDPAGPAVRLAHPLYAEVVRAGLPRFAARHRHGELARAALAAGYHRHDPLRVATWQLAGDDPGDPDLLLRAAHVAYTADEVELSERLARAAEGTGAGWPAVLQRAAALGPAGRWDEADTLLAALTAPDAPLAARVAATRVRAESMVWHRGRSVAEARDVVTRELAVIPDGAAAPLLDLAARLAFAELDLDPAGTLATAASSAATTPAERLHGLGAAAVVTAFRGHARAATDLVVAATPHAAALAVEDPLPAGYLAAAFSFAAPLAGLADQAAALFARFRHHELLATYRSLRGFPALCLARAQLAQGRVAPAARLSHEVLTSMVGDENHYGRGNWVVATLAAAAGQAGDAATAAEALAWIDDHRAFPVAPDTLGLDLGRVWLHAARGEMSSAAALALAVADRSRAVRCGLLEAMALVDAARLGAAAEAADRLAGLAATLGGPFLAAAATFAGALPAGSRSGSGAGSGDGDGLDAAADGFAAIGARLLAAESAAAAADAHGARGRRRDQAASRARALRLAGECEGAATPLLCRLAQEPPAARLTRREREVAELAARGRSNREIGEALHVSRRTVDSHLDHAYTKLGITTRRELPTALGLP